MSKFSPRLSGMDGEIRPMASPSSDADHDAWAKAKIEDALREAKAHPERRIPQDRIWKKFGLEH